ncbi:MAG TPA: type IV toxin-antitoxin system AbiEi family antitoxin domain-containing protein [Ignavibacteriales bacterium]|nr:type IV toxin-antitoxin system AbiEi family antitoxin domain-containing protein [Ignavibacteriales bacterium]
MEKINSLITNWPKGTIALTSHLNRAGLQNDLLHKYTRSRWLESVGNGAYKLNQDKVGWEGAVYALQKQAGFSMHPGGKTALELKGLAHYASQGESTVNLFGPAEELLPRWFMSQEWSRQVKYVRTNLFDYKSLSGYSAYETKGIEITISSAELAMLEMLYMVPKYNSFDEAYLIMEGLTTLRSRLLQRLLEECRSIKVKRLFLYMAEKSGHSWFNELQTGKLDLGTGKRLIVKSGRLNHKYNITVPKEYEEQQIF